MIQINDDDFKAEHYNPNPPGGQQVGLTSYPVKVTHEPTGLFAVSGSERSQHHNRRIAKAMVMAGLVEAFGCKPLVEESELTALRLAVADMSEALRFYLNENDVGYKEWIRRMGNDCGESAQQALTRHKAVIEGLD